jgi:hypothetical protein
MGPNAHYIVSIGPCCKTRSLPCQEVQQAKGHRSANQNSANMLFEGAGFNAVSLTAQAATLFITAPKKGWYSTQ